MVEKSRPKGREEQKLIITDQRDEIQSEGFSDSQDTERNISDDAIITNPSIKKGKVPSLKPWKDLKVEDYRSKLKKAFEEAQLKWQKKNGIKVEAADQKLSKDNKESLTKSAQGKGIQKPKVGMMDAQRTFHKDGGKIGKDLVRYFAIDDKNFIQSKPEGFCVGPIMKANSKMSSKLTPLLGSIVVLESRDEATAKKTHKWTSKDAKETMRVSISFKTKDKVDKTYFIYSSDLDYLKKLAVDVKCVSNPALTKKIKKKATKAINIDKTLLIDSFITNVREHVDKKIEKFTMTKSNVVIRKSDLRSSFRKGEAVTSIQRSMEDNISKVLHHRMQQLANMIRTRKYQRKTKVQEDIINLERHVAQGFRCEKVSFFSQASGGQIAEKKSFTNGNGRIYFEHRNTDHMLVENLESSKFEQRKFFENEYLTRLNLKKISFMATDQPGFLTPKVSCKNHLWYYEDCDGCQKASGMDAESLKQPFTIKIYGPVTKRVLESKVVTNQTTEFAGHSPLRTIPKELFKAKIHSLKFPAEFAKQHHSHGFVRVRITQVIDQEKHFTILSTDFRFIPKQNVNNEYELKIPGLNFVLAPFHDTDEENFTVEVLYYSNLNPVPTVVKDFMNSNVFENGDGIKLTKEHQQRFPYKVTDDGGRSATVDMEVFYRQNPTEKDIACIDEREGPRIHVGRHCLYLSDEADQPKVQEAQVVQFNTDNTVKLRALRTSELLENGNDIPIDRIKKIERYGVSVYSYADLPEQIQQSSYAWTCIIKSTDRLLLTTILSKIQNAHVTASFKKRVPVHVQKSGIVSGNILCSVVEAKNLRHSHSIQPYVKIVTEIHGKGKKPQANGSPFKSRKASSNITSKIEAQNNRYDATWRNKDREDEHYDPTGHTTNLGQFSKNLNSKASQQDFSSQSTFVMGLEMAQEAENQVWDDEVVVVPTPRNQADSEDVFIKFEVFHDDVLLGQSIPYQATKFIDLKKNQRAQQILLLLPKKKVESDDQSSQLEPISNDATRNFNLSGTLLINTLFIPDMKTRFEFSLYDDYSIFKTPEAKMHHQLLMGHKMFDHYHYAVPLSFYDPSNHTEDVVSTRQDSNKRPDILNNLADLEEFKKELREEFNEKRNLPIEERLIFQKKAISNAIEKKIFSCPEEILDYFVWLTNQNRPIKQQYTADFSKMWQANSMQISYDSRKKINRFIWQHYLSGLVADGQTLPTALVKQESKRVAQEEVKKDQSAQDKRNSFNKADLERRGTFITGAIEDLHKQASKMSLTRQSKKAAEGRRSTLGKRNSIVFVNNPALAAESHDPFGSLDLEGAASQESAYDQIMQNKEQTLLMFAGKWEEQGDQKYKDLYHLIHKGIPDELRPKIWRELLKVGIQEMEEIEKFKKTYGSDKNFKYDENESLFINYIIVAEQTDCLSFQQIDEDIDKFTFGQDYFENADDLGEINLIHRSEKNQMRTILRALILWSKIREVEGVDCTITYGAGFMRIIQRLITITHNEEDCFWIVTGLIRSFPRPFEVKSSVLDSDIDSCMRYEMTAFKALMKQNLPNVNEKLQDYGFPVEFLIYKTMGSFYSDYFTSELVLRLWDIVIFNFSSSKKDERRRGLWYLLSAAFFVLSTRESQILKATSVAQIIQSFESGGAITYDPDLFIDRLVEINKELFAEGVKQASMTMTRFLSGMIRNQVQEHEISAENMNAHDFEEQRKKYMDQLKEIFQIVRDENKKVEALVDEGNEYLKNNPYRSGQQESSTIDNNLLRNNFLTKVKKVAGMVEKERNEEELMLSASVIDIDNVGDLKIKRAHVYLHGLTQHPRYIKTGYKVKLSYGSFNTDTQHFQVLETGKQRIVKDGDIIECFDRHMSKDDVKFETHSSFAYDEGCNHIKIELVEADGKQNLIGDASISLGAIPTDKFAFQTLLFRNQAFLENDQSYMHSLTHIQVSFYLESEHKGKMSQNKKSLMEIQKKMPDRIDIFNNKANEDLSAQFEKLIKQEETDLNKFTPEEVDNIINETYNFVQKEGTKSMTLKEFQNLCDSILPSALRKGSSKKYCRQIFNAFTDTEDFEIEGIEEQEVEGSDNSVQMVFEDGRRSARSTHRGNQSPRVTEEKSQHKTRMSYMKKVPSTLTKVNRSTLSVDNSAGSLNLPQLEMKKAQSLAFPAHMNNALGVVVEGEDEEGQEVSFSLRSFITALVLMSHCTVDQKVGILFDLYDFVDGTDDGNMPGQIFEIVQTIFERNLYFWPTHELYNQLENVFSGSVSMVYQAYWTRNVQSIQEMKPRRQCMLADIMSDKMIDFSTVGTSINITKEVQTAFTNYFSVFGTKMIDFNPDVSAFKDLRQLIGKEQAEKLLTATGGSRHMMNIVSEKQRYKLSLFCTVDQERFNFEINYDNITGELLQSETVVVEDDPEDQKEWMSYFKRNSKRIHLIGMTRPISKEEFIDKMEQLPLFTNLIRVETFYRDRTANSLKPKNPVIAPIYCTLSVASLLFLFKFKQRTRQIDEGLDVRPDVEKKVITFEMGELSEEDVLSDIRARIVDALVCAQSKVRQKEWKQMLAGANIELVDILGSRIFSVLSQAEDWMDWQVQPKDRTRLFTLGEHPRNRNRPILLKLESCSSKIFESAQKLKVDDSAYNSLSLYKHPDKSQEWRRCKVISRRQKLGRQDAKNATFDSQCFEYEIEFLHLREQSGQQMWFTRNSEEILFGGGYTRLIQRSFKQEIDEYIEMTYKGINPK